MNMSPWLRVVLASATLGVAVVAAGLLTNLWALVSFGLTLTASATYYTLGRSHGFREHQALSYRNQLEAKAHFMEQMLADNPEEVPEEVLDMIRKDYQRTQAELRDMRDRNA